MRVRVYNREGDKIKHPWRGMHLAIGALIVSAIARICAEGMVFFGDLGDRWIAEADRRAEEE
jgi:hypothetical protein